MKIIVGLSGGVDSSMAALLLRDEGHEVIGVTLKVWSPENHAAASHGIESALAVARQLGIEHHVVDAEREFRKRVVTYFCEEYRRGRTPNPCVVCNPAIKFASLLRYADEKGVVHIATGHYARLKESGGRWILLRGADRKKDQSYFLSQLAQPVLSRAVFPLGAYRKEDVKRLAAERGLKAHSRPESQEICFVPDDDYRAFLKQMSGATIQPGDILDTGGTVVGRHSGIEYFTIGQRSGLQLNSKIPRYVLSIDPVRQALTVGGIEDLLRHEMRVREINWIAFDSPPRDLSALVKIRYNHPGIMGTVHTGGDGSAVVRFAEPQKAVTPGQAAVFYDGDIVLAGGWIE